MILYASTSSIFLFSEMKAMTHSKVHVADDIQFIHKGMLSTRERWEHVGTFIGQTNTNETYGKHLGSCLLVSYCLWWWCRLNVIWVHKVLTKAALCHLSTHTWLSGKMYECAWFSYFRLANTDRPTAPNRKKLSSSLCAAGPLGDTAHQQSCKGSNLSSRSIQLSDLII